VILGDPIYSGKKSASKLKGSTNVEFGIKDEEWVGFCERMVGLCFPYAED